MNCFEILGIEPTDDIRAIKRAYAARSRECHPEEHPEEFQVLHNAYEAALAYAKWRKARAEWEEEQEPPRAEEAWPDGEEPSEEEEDGKEDEVDQEPFPNPWNEQFERLTAAGWGDEAGRKDEAGQEETDQEDEVDQEEESAQEAEPNEEPFSNPWNEQFEKLAAAGEKRAEINEAVLALMDRFHALYMDERQRNHLSLWRSFFDEPFDHPMIPAILSSQEFVEAWYQFLGSHHHFTEQIWQYFATLDGYRFHSEQYGIPRFPYSVYIEKSRQEQVHRAFWESGETGQRDTARRKERPDDRGATDRTAPSRRRRRAAAGGKWRQNKAWRTTAKVIKYVLCMIGAEVGGVVLGTIAAMLFG